MLWQVKSSVILATFHAYRIPAWQKNTRCSAELGAYYFSKKQIVLTVIQYTNYA